MCKKIAAGAQVIVLDVKVGVGAFMQNIEDATELSHRMVAIGALSGRKVAAVLADMNQPLGTAVGNVLEVREALETLHGRGPADFREHCLTMASHLLTLGGKAANLEGARKMAETNLGNECAFNKFRALVAAQGGDVHAIDHPETMANATLIEPMLADRSGYLAQVNARVVGEAAVVLGGGRAKKSDAIDHAVGIIVHHKVGDQVKADEPLFTIHANSREKFEAARTMLVGAIQWSDSAVAPLPLFYGVIS
jgi:pyrimidine-nucleoside phosphorylase